MLFLYIGIVLRVEGCSKLITTSVSYVSSWGILRVLKHWVVVIVGGCFAGTRQSLSRQLLLWTSGSDWLCLALSRDLFSM